MQTDGKVTSYALFYFLKIRKVDQREKISKANREKRKNNKLMEEINKWPKKKQNHIEGKTVE
jgi:hypothetical protein